MICPFRVKGKLQYANKHIAVWKNYNFPYVGIIQIRSQVEAIQLPLSLLDTQAPLFFIYIYYTPFFPHCNPYFLYNLIWIWYFFIQ